MDLEMCPEPHSFSLSHYILCFFFHEKGFISSTIRPTISKVFTLLFDKSREISKQIINFPKVIIISWCGHKTTFFKILLTSSE